MTIIQIKKNNQIPAESGFHIIEFKDYFINPKAQQVKTRGLGEKTASLNAFFFDYLKGYNIYSAYIKKVSSKTLQFTPVSELSFRIKILNAADARTSKIFSIKQGAALDLPIQEYHFGSAKETLITESHIISFNLCSYEDLKMINRICSKLNAIVKSFFERRNLNLIELTCIFGKLDGKIYLIGDFSPMSIKVVPQNADIYLPDPYKIETFTQMKKYADYLLKFTNGE